MTLILCIDDNGGIAFCGKRQSKDRVVLEDIRRISEGGCLWVSPYTQALFMEYGLEEIMPQLHTDTVPGARAQTGDYLFWEAGVEFPAGKKIEQMVLYVWGRSYPATETAQFPKGAWALESVESLQGYSHPEIVKIHLKRLAEKEEV